MAIRDLQTRAKGQIETVRRAAGQRAGELEEKAGVLGEEARERGRRVRRRAADRANEVRKTARRKRRTAERRVGKARRKAEQRVGKARRKVGTARRKIGYTIAGQEPRTGRWGIAAAGAAVGAAAAFFLDPISGKRRRHVARDKAASGARTVSRRIGRKARWAQGRAEGVAHELTTTGDGGPPPNDETLVQKVRSEALGGEGIHSGEINVRAHRGVVELRGTVERPQQVRTIEERVRSVEGVVEVENLLQLQGSQRG